MITIAFVSSEIQSKIVTILIYLIIESPLLFMELCSEKNRKWFCCGHRGINLHMETLGGDA